MIFLLSKFRRILCKPSLIILFAFPSSPIFYSVLYANVSLDLGAPRGFSGPEEAGFYSFKNSTGGTVSVLATDTDESSKEILSTSEQGFHRSVYHVSNLLNTPVRNILQPSLFKPGNIVRYFITRKTKLCFAETLFAVEKDSHNDGVKYKVFDSTTSIYSQYFEKGRFDCCAIPVNSSKGSSTPTFRELLYDLLYIFTTP